MFPRRSVKNKKQLLLRLFTAKLVVLLLVFGWMIIDAKTVKADIENNMNGQGIYGEPYIVEDCEDLQNITLNLSAYYKLAGNIDCSDTINWNGGAGFKPIGIQPDNSQSSFHGHFDGQGYIISNLYINGEIGYSYANIGMFADIRDNGAGVIPKVLNFGLSNFDITAAIPGENGTTSVGLLAGSSGVADIDRVNAFGNLHRGCEGDLNTQTNIGGLIGNASNTYIDHSFTSGIYSDEPCINQTIIAGGLIGYSYIAQVHNSHSNASFNIDSKRHSVKVARIGGLIGSADQSLIYKSFSFVNITLQYNPGEFQSYQIGGLVGYMEDTQLQDNFVQSVINVNTSCNGSECDQGIRALGAIVGENNTPYALFSNYYDETFMSVVLDCEGALPHMGGCVAINTAGSPDPSYFWDNSTNPPLDTWDFVNDWALGCSGCAPNTGGPMPYPDPIEIVSTTINSETSFSINSEQNGFLGQGGSEPGSLRVLIRQVGETEWSVPNFSVGPHPDLTITDLQPSTNYQFKIVISSQDWYYSVSAIGTANTATAGFGLINDCQELQDIQNNLATNFELANDIDCSDTINWNGGSGFNSIGEYNPFISVDESYKGVFKGNNYTISDVYIDSTGVDLFSGLFASTRDALIQDVKIDRLTLIADSLSITGGVTGSARVTDIKNVHVNDAIASGNFLGFGGITAIQIVANDNPKEIILENNSFTGSVTVNGPLSNDISEGFSGLYGQIALYSSESTVKVKNNYANFTLDDNMGVSIRAGVVGFVLKANPTGNHHIKIENNYSAGDVNVLPAYSQPTVVGAINGLSVDAAIEYRNNFSDLRVNGTPPVDLIVTGLLGHYQDTGNGVETMTASNNYFDADKLGTTDCNNGSTSITCTPISGSPSYFYNNTTNPPLDTWDFYNIWITTSTLPVFGHNVLTGSTPIPPERLNPPTEDNDNGSGGGVTSPPGSIDEPLESSFLDFGGSTTAQPENKSIIEKLADKVKEFFKNIPEGVLRSFPYVLFGLTGLGIFLMLLETRKHLAKYRSLKILIAKQRSIAQQRDTFWHLAAN